MSQLDLDAESLYDYGLWGGEARGLMGTLRFERPAYLFDARRIKNVTLGAFSYINGQYTSSLYDCRVGRYCSIAESVVLGPYEHPTDGLTTHTFAFSGPDEFPPFFRFPEYAAIARDSTPEDSINKRQTEVGHDVWLGAGCLIKRGVKIGNGAVIAAHAVVTRDVPDYAIVVGAPGKVQRLRFDERTVERLLRLAWWNYDLAPLKNRIDLSRMPEALDLFEAQLAAGALQPLQPKSYEVRRKPGPRFDVRELPAPLF
ncbi:hypothetical protein SAMN04488038_1137 [Solimonas aquatica]|uniref:Transferase hexapeptide (Six repeat-containing protein) n=1 Tax=Solimonas aquatica TaxID=489703 RepID=A0A1H9K9V2_9GAMM|nr:CatB-related O-acetyltransferase [Solimonas aquatica]SEQ95899.1 hypothetical protein SAMN04488038_1137 [Solimonas aquatica]